MPKPSKGYSTNWRRRSDDWLWKNQDGVLCLLTRLRAGRSRTCSLILGRGKKFFLSTKHLTWPWGPLSLLLSVFQELFLLEQSGKVMKLTTYLRLVLRSGVNGAILPLPHLSSCYEQTQLYMLWYAMKLMASLCRSKIARFYDVFDTTSVSMMPRSYSTVELYCCWHCFK
jgi:hypothetical protein